MARWIGRATTTFGTRGGRDDATSAYLDQFARELQALRLDFKMSRGAVRIARLGAARKARIRRGKRWGSEGAFSRLFTRTGRDAVLTRRLPLRLFMMTTTVTSGHGGSSSSGSRSSFPLGFGRPSSARTSLLMAAAPNPNLSREKEQEARRARTAPSRLGATESRPLRRRSVFLKYSRERALLPGAPTHAASPSRGQMASPERVAVTFLFYDVVPRRGKRKDSRRSVRRILISLNTNTNATMMFSQ